MAETHALKHEVNISAELETIRAALATSQGLQGWNTPLVKGTGELGTEWILRYTGQPEFHWRIDSNDPETLSGPAPKDPATQLARAPISHYCPLTMVERPFSSRMRAGLTTGVTSTNAIRSGVP
jgi:hypothetical protein